MLLNQGSSSYFYVLKPESDYETAGWRDILSFIQDHFGLSRRVIKATMFIEALPAVFQIDEILYSLRYHFVGSNCGCCDGLVRYIRTLENYQESSLADRQSIMMHKDFLSAYSRLWFKTYHRRGVLAMRGIAAFLPSKEMACQTWVMNEVRMDKELEAGNGSDSAWRAHTGLADEVMDGNR